MDTKKRIAHYYDSCECDYKNYWDLDRSLAMHAGYWDETTRTLHEALIKENQVLASLSKIKSSDHVLDAGCGVGGSAIFLAENYRCRVTGITLSEKQAEKAKNHAFKRHVDHLVNFHSMDFCQTTFADRTFDLVWGLESICHAEDKQRFAEEAYRILKPGGRLIVADGFANKKYCCPSDNLQMSKWLKGWGVNSLELVEDFAGYLEASGFKNISFKNITPHVLPSSRRLYYLSFPATVLSVLGEIAGFRTKVQTDNIKSAYYQYKTLRKVLWKYGIFYADKG